MTLIFEDNGKGDDDESDFCCCWSGYTLIVSKQEIWSRFEIWVVKI